MTPLNRTNRRDFVKLAATAAATATLASPSFLRAGMSGGSPTVHAWVTTKDKRYQPMDAPQWHPWSAVSPISIDLDPSQRYQEILGFGGAFTDATCSLMHQLDPKKRADLLAELYGPQGLRLSVGRTCIGASDYSKSVYSFDDSDQPDPDLKKFSIDHDRAYILPTLIEASKTNPDLFLFSSPWSPPAWMKPSHTMLGGNMSDTYFAPYAQYFLKFLKEYEAAGVKIRAVTVQNESDTDQSGRMPQAEWGQQYEAGFVSNFLGPVLEKSAPNTKIWILDHNYNLWGRVLDELSDPNVYKYVDGVAWHGYVGTPDAMTRVHNAFPQKSAYWTEGGPDVSDPAYATNWAIWGETFSGILHNWARCIVSWNLLLDEQGKPDIGPFSCGGVVTVNSKTGELTRSGQYWAFAHFSKVMQRGSRIIGSFGDMPGISHVAAQNPDGSHALVVTNKGPEQHLQCTLGSMGINMVLPADSICSFTW